MTIPNNGNFNQLKSLISNLIYLIDIMPVSGVMVKINEMGTLKSFR